MSLTPAERKLTVKGKNKSIICAFLIVLYKMEITQGGECNLGEFNNMPLSIFTTTETVWL